MKQKSHQKKAKVNKEMLIAVIFVVLLMGINTAGIMYLYYLFNQVVNYTPVVSTANTTTSPLLQPFNRALYNSIEKDRQTRKLYTPGEPAPPVSLKQVF